MDGLGDLPTGNNVLVYNVTDIEHVVGLAVNHRPTVRCDRQHVQCVQTMHFRLSNALSKSAAEMNLPKDHEQSAYRLHADLFASGMERILLVSGSLHLIFV